MLCKFNYKNHRGEIALRTVEATAIEFLSAPGYGYQPGWFLSGIDKDKNSRRSFALCNIILDDQLKHGFSPNFMILLY